jgi:RNA polymerase sigma factor (sigma-70 family)
MRSTPERQHQLGEFFAANSDRLERAVARKINARRELIEDACASAWRILLRRPDVTLDARGRKWLTTVAVNEALELLRRTRGETSVGAFQADTRGHDDEDVPPLPDTGAPGADERALQHIEHAERVEAFRQLKPREREALYFKALGYSYHEIAAMTDATYTAVNRRISEGRAVLRGGRRNQHRASLARRAGRASDEHPGAGGEPPAPGP